MRTHLGWFNEKENESTNPERNQILSFQNISPIFELKNYEMEAVEDY